MPFTPFSGALVIRTTNLSATNDLFPVIDWDTVEYDVGGYFSMGATDRLTVPTTGYYLFGAMGRWDMVSNATAGARGLGIWLNGDDPTTDENIGYVEWPNMSVSGAYVFQTPVGPVRHLTAGDYIRAHAYQHSSGALDLIASQGKTPAFWIVQVG